MYDICTHLSVNVVCIIYNKFVSVYVHVCVCVHVFGAKRCYTVLFFEFYTIINNKYIYYNYDIVHFFSP